MAHTGLNKNTHRLRGSESRILSNNAHYTHKFAIDNDEIRRNLQAGRRGDPPKQQNNDNTDTDNDDWGSYMSHRTPPTPPPPPPPPPATPPGPAPNPQSSPYNYGSSPGGGGASTSTTNTNSNPYDSSASTTSTTNTNSNPYGSSASASSYGSGSSSYGRSPYGSASSGSSSPYGSSSSGSYGSYGSSAASKTSTTGGGYSSAWGAGAGETSSGSTWGSTSGSAWGAPSSSFKGFSNLSVTSPKVGVLSVVLLSAFFTFTGMLITAHRMEHDPEGNFANCCRVLLHTVTCIYKVIYNLYHCRLGDIPQVVFASELEEEEYTEEEIERMRLRPGIERALDVEHRKALRKVGIEMNKIKPANPTNKNKSGVPRSASMDVR